VRPFEKNHNESTLIVVPSQVGSHQPPYRSTDRQFADLSCLLDGDSLGTPPFLAPLVLAGTARWKYRQGLGIRGWELGKTPPQTATVASDKRKDRAQATGYREKEAEERGRVKSGE
jgi:hypothetical protein